MNSVIQILAAVLAAVSCSFLQTSSNRIQSALNSTLFVASEPLFKPIYIPNVVNYSEDPQTKVTESQGMKVKEMILKNNLQEISQESKIRKNYSSEIPKTTENPFRFSSRYSTKQEDSSQERSRFKKIEKPREEERKTVNSSGIIRTPNSLERNEKETTSFKSDDIRQTEKHKSFSERSDELDDNEEESEESIEISPTTNEPYSELPKPTSFRKYSNDDFENYETTSTEVEETEDSKETEKEDEEDKSSTRDYYNSGSKNYHSIQTPLHEIKYRGHHSFKDDIEPEKIRTNSVSAIDRHPPSHKWHYSRPQIKEELEKLNEISDRDESYEKILDEEVKEEVKAGPKQLGLELAVEKDEFKFDRSRKYNHVDERNHQKQRQKGLSIEEEKDDKVPLFQSFKLNQTDEKISNYKPKINTRQKMILPTKTTLSTTPKNIFKIKKPPRRQPKNFNISSELVPNFQNHQFLVPDVFNHNLKQSTNEIDAQSFTKTQKQPMQNALLKGLLEKEKLDQDELINQRIQKPLFENGSKETLSFNHLEDNEEIYNAILANIRSVFGVRIQSGKSSVSSQNEPDPEIKLDESKPFTWSLPLIQREKIN